jgi:hypothetical protein
VRDGRRVRCGRKWLLELPQVDRMPAARSKERAGRHFRLEAFELEGEFNSLDYST